VRQCSHSHGARHSLPINAVDASFTYRLCYYQARVRGTDIRLQKDLAGQGNDLLTLSAELRDVGGVQGSGGTLQLGEASGRDGLSIASA